MEGQTLKQVQGDGCTDKFEGGGNFWVVIITPFFSDNKLLNTGVLGAEPIGEGVAEDTTKRSDSWLERGEDLPPWGILTIRLF